VGTFQILGQKQGKCQYRHCLGIWQAFWLLADERAAEKAARQGRLQGAAAGAAGRAMPAGLHHQRREPGDHAVVFPLGQLPPEAAGHSGKQYLGVGMSF
jgi:hypothetical protein